MPHGTGMGAGAPAPLAADAPPPLWPEAPDEPAVGMVESESSPQPHAAEQSSVANDALSKVRRTADWVGMLCRFIDAAVQPAEPNGSTNRRNASTMCHLFQPEPGTRIIEASPSARSLPSAFCTLLWA